MTSEWEIRKEIFLSSLDSEQKQRILHYINKSYLAGKNEGYSQALEELKIFINELDDLPYCWVDTICNKIEELSFDFAEVKK